MESKSIIFQKNILKTRGLSSAALCPGHHYCAASSGGMTSSPLQQWLFLHVTSLQVTLLLKAAFEQKKHFDKIVPTGCSCDLSFPALSDQTELICVFLYIMFYACKNFLNSSVKLLLPLKNHFCCFALRYLSFTGFLGHFYSLPCAS